MSILEGDFLVVGTQVPVAPVDPPVDPPTTTNFSSLVSEQLFLGNTQSQTISEVQ